MKITLDVSGSELVLLGDLDTLVDPVKRTYRYRFIPSCSFFGPTMVAFKIINGAGYAPKLLHLQQDAAGKVCAYYSKNYPHLTFRIKDVDYDYK